LFPESGEERNFLSVFFIVQKKTEVYRDRKLKMDLVGVLTRQYHFLSFKKNFSRNTPPCQVEINNKSIVRNFSSAGRPLARRPEFSIYF
jgi:hypothetical protein